MLPLHGGRCRYRAGERAWKESTDLTHELPESGIEGGRGGDDLGEAGGAREGAAEADSGPGVGHPVQRLRPPLVPGDAQPRHPRRGVDQQRHLLRHRQPADQVPRPGPDRLTPLAERQPRRRTPRPAGERCTGGGTSAPYEGGDDNGEVEEEVRAAPAHQSCHRRAAEVVHEAEQRVHRFQLLRRLPHLVLEVGVQITAAVAYGAGSTTSGSSRSAAELLAWVVKSSRCYCFFLRDLQADSLLESILFSFLSSIISCGFYSGI
ncbi:hypothetical protein GW17_00026818 [Ensete ventricosum]|nr:hypothetical protein GW17_00026818 [Ensete ventricosum]